MQNNGGNTKQLFNNNRITTLERSAKVTGGGANAFYCQTFALDADAVKPEKSVMLELRLIQCIATGRQSNVLTYCDETKKRALNSQTDRAKENPLVEL